MLDDVFGAIRVNDADRLARLLDADPELAGWRDEGGISPLSLAAYMGRADLVQIIRSRRGRPDFFEALLVGDDAVVRDAIAGGQDVDGRAPDGFTPLGLAVFFGQADLARMLIDAGADIDARAENAQKVGPIHAAVAQGNLAMLDMLLARGADPNAAQQQGVRPVHAAASRGDAPAVALLIFFGANLDATSDPGQTAADYARERGHLSLAEQIEKFRTR